MSVNGKFDRKLVFAFTNKTPNFVRISEVRYTK